MINTQLTNNNDANIDEKKQSHQLIIYQKIYDIKFNTQNINWNELHHIAFMEGRILFVNNIINQHYSQYLKHYNPNNNNNPLSLPSIPNLSPAILSFISSIISQTLTVNKAHNVLHSHNNWTTQVDNYDGISVYYRPENNGLHSIKISFTAKCHPLYLISVINEFDLMSEVITAAPMETRYLKEFTPLHKALYSKINLTWPLKNKDCVGQAFAYNLLNEYNEVLIWGKSYDTIKDVTIPAIINGTSRVEVMMAQGVIKPKLDSNNNLITEVIASYNVDAKSSVPKSLINWVTRKSVYYGCKMFRDRTQNLKGTKHEERIKQKDIYKKWKTTMDEWKAKQILKQKKK